MTDDTPKLRVIVAGARGRMGSLAVGAIEEAPDLELVGTLLRGDEPERLLEKATVDILLDLSLADASRRIAPLAARRGIAPVVGTSGLDAADLDALRAACEHGGTGGLVIPNFSVGAVIQMQTAERLAAHLTCTGVHEVHHPAKLDAPSGTAKATAARIRQGAVARDPEAGPPRITSERAEGVLARQTVTFDDPAERLVLDHEVRDRSAYLPGILLALRAVTSIPELRVGLDTLLGSSLQASLQRDLAQARERLV